MRCERNLPKYRRLLHSHSQRFPVNAELCTLVRWIAAPGMLLVASCATNPAPQVRREARIDCVAEVIEVKQEAWQVRLSAYSSSDTVWQGVLVMSLRMVSPAGRAGVVYNLGVFEESEIVIGGRSLVRGDRVRFKATESVLERWVVPEVFSNLEGVARAGESANGQAPASSPSQPGTSQ